MEQHLRGGPGSPATVAKYRQPSDRAIDQFTKHNREAKCSCRSCELMRAYGPAKVVSRD